MNITKYIAGEYNLDESFVEPYGKYIESKLENYPDFTKRIVADATGGLILSPCSPIQVLTIIRFFIAGIKEEL